MPIYEYNCPDCGEDQENLIRSMDVVPVCEKCGGQSLKRKLSVFAVSSATDNECGCSDFGGTCGSPGACTCC